MLQYGCRTNLQCIQFHNYANSKPIIYSYACPSSSDVPYPPAVALLWGAACTAHIRTPAGVSPAGPYGRRHNAYYLPQGGAGTSGSLGGGSGGFPRWLPVVASRGGCFPWCWGGFSCPHPHPNIFSKAYTHSDTVPSPPPSPSANTSPFLRISPPTPTLPKEGSRRDRAPWGHKEEAHTPQADSTQGSSCLYVQGCWGLDTSSTGGAWGPGAAASARVLAGRRLGSGGRETRKDEGEGVPGTRLGCEKKASQGCLEEVFGDLQPCAIRE
ncbi:hypothetical protein AAMO2058_000880600 [Amorphochlora amoebiformis]